MSAMREALYADWYVTDNDGLETTIRDRSDPGEEFGDEDGAVCWGATPQDAERIVRARMLTVFILDFAKGGQICLDGVDTDLDELNRLIHYAREAEGAPPSPVRAMPLGERVKALEEVIGKLLSCGDEASGECFWCLQPTPGPECKNDECPSVVAVKLTQMV